MSTERITFTLDLNNPNDQKISDFLKICGGKKGKIIKQLLLLIAEQYGNVVTSDDTNFLLRSIELLGLPGKMSNTGINQTAELYSLLEKFPGWERKKKKARKKKIMIPDPAEAEDLPEEKITENKSEPEPEVSDEDLAALRNAYSDLENVFNL